ncbi:MAG: hypothetical protein M3Q50_02060 [Chloroflexota bacterium]|nr:hypothetical protein [Chloroflexota bacterium]
MVKQDERDRELNRFWNAVVAGDPAAGEFALAAEDMAIVRRLHRAGSSQPTASSAANAWPAVLTRIAPASAAHDEPVHLGISSPRIFLETQSPPHRAPLPAHRERGWGEGLAAALILLTLTAGLFAYGPLGLPSRETPILVPAVDDTMGIAAGQLELLWESTGGAEPFDDPYALSIDPAGNLWVADSDKGRFQIFAPDGTFIETWGAPGNDEGQFIFSDPTGRDSYGFGDAAFDAGGNLYVVDPGNYRVQKFAPDRRFLLSWGDEGVGDGQFLVATAIAVDAAGTVYISDERRADVQMFDGQGTFLGAFGGLGIEEGQFILPEGMAIDPRGMIWVVDRGNSRLQQFTSTGELRAIVGRSGYDDGEFSVPQDVAIDGGGRLYVIERDGDRLQVLTPDGRMLAVAGGPTDGDPTTDDFNSPLGVAVDAAGTVYVSDSNSVQAFRLLLPTGSLLIP